MRQRSRQQSCSFGAHTCCLLNNATAESHRAIQGAIGAFVKWFKWSQQENRTDGRVIYQGFRRGSVEAALKTSCDSENVSTREDGASARMARKPIQRERISALRLSIASKQHRSRVRSQRRPSLSCETSHSTGRLVEQIYPSRDTPLWMKALGKDTRRAEQSSGDNAITNCTQASPAVVANCCVDRRNNNNMEGSHRRNAPQRNVRFLHRSLPSQITQIGFMHGNMRLMAELGR